MVQEQPENQTDNFTFERSFPRKSARTGTESGYLCNKNPCHGVKEWQKPGSSIGLGGISPPARQPVALGGNVLSAHHSFVLSSLTFCLPTLGSVGANSEKVSAAAEM